MAGFLTDAQSVRTRDDAADEDAILKAVRSRTLGRELLEPAKPPQHDAHPSGKSGDGGSESSEGYTQRHDAGWPADDPNTSHTADTPAEALRVLR